MSKIFGTVKTQHALQRGALMKPFVLPKPTVLKFESLFCQGLTLNEAGIGLVWAATKLLHALITALPAWFCPYITVSLLKNTYHVVLK